MFCNKCGTEYQDGDLFCAKCGSPLHQTRSLYTRPFEQAKTEKFEDVKDTLHYGADSGQGGQNGPSGQGGARPGGFSVNGKSINLNVKVPEGILDYLKLGFTKPLDAVQLGTDSDKFTSTLSIIGVKDILLSLMAVFAISGLISSVTSGYGYSGFDVMREMDMSAPKVFFTLLLLLIVMDFVVMMSLFGLGKLFRGEGSPKEWISTAGACFMLPFAAEVLGLLFCTSRSTIAVAMILFMVGSLFSMVLWIKALEKRMKLSGNGLLFGFTAGVVVGWLIEGVILYSVLDNYLQSLSYYF